MAPKPPLTRAEQTAAVINTLTDTVPILKSDIAYIVRKFQPSYGSWTPEAREVITRLEDALKENP